MQHVRITCIYDYIYGSKQRLVLFQFGLQLKKKE